MSVRRVRVGGATRRGAVAASLLCLVVVAGAAGSAAAHDPIIVTDRQLTPDEGPLLPDGTVSFALYGSLGAAGDTRGFRVRFEQGDRLDLSLLVPALDPEQGLAADALPSLEVTAPDGAVRAVPPTERVRFDEPFSGTSYLRLATVGEDAQAGEYRVTVVGAAPARFTVSVGTDERFGTPVEGVEDRDAGVAGVQRWYATPPVAAATTLPPPTSVAVSGGVSGEVVTTPVGDTAVAPSAVPAAASATSAGPTNAVPEVPPTSVGTSGTGSAAGSAVFFGALAAIGIGGAVLYARRRTPPPE